MEEKTKEILTYLAKNICGKNIDYINLSNRKTQSVDTIFGTTTEIIHEIAHWMASDINFRHLDNLGFPYNIGIDDIEHPLYNRMHSEEAVACYLTKLLFDKYFPFHNIENEIMYINYLNDQGKIISICTGTISVQEAYAKAKELFELYTKDLNYVEME